MKKERKKERKNFFLNQGNKKKMATKQRSS